MKLFKKLKQAFEPQMHQNIDFYNTQFDGVRRRLNELESENKTLQSDIKKLRFEVDIPKPKNGERLIIKDEPYIVVSCEIGLSNVSRYHHSDVALEIGKYGECPVWAIGVIKEGTFDLKKALYYGKGVYRFVY